MQHPNHHHHDLLLVAAHAADDLTGPERQRAESLLSTCADCAAVHRDLVSITTASMALPSVASAPRDFRITPEQASRLRRRSWVQTLLGPIAGPRSVARPMATAFTSLGVAGLLIATLLPAGIGALGGSAASAPERDLAQPGAVASAAGGAFGAAATSAPAPAAPSTAPDVRPVAGGATTAPEVEFGSKDGASSPPDVAVDGGVDAETPGADDASGRLASAYPPSPLFVGSLALLALGLLLFGLRFAGRRLR
jgi:hypothetical protein